MDAAANAGQRECRGTGTLCIGMGPVVGLVAGVVVVIAGCLAGFAVLRMRPLRVMVPVGTVAMVMTVYVYLAAVPGGRLHPLPVFALVAAIVFALLAMTALPPTRVAGSLGLLGVLLASFLFGGFVHQAVQRHRDVAALAGLPVPLLIPDLSRYGLQSAYPGPRSLSLSLIALSGSTPRIEVLITPVPQGFDPPERCLDVQPSPTIQGFDGDAACRPAGPGRWQRADPDTVQLVERRNDALVILAGSTPDIDLADLGAAADSLRPTTAEDLRAEVEHRA
ncbi:hypothetical protein [Herbidospora mongoliensis]|uniref:hypothetical protein n=1 Tax=Herbidospora mongoliensis TaxID=688067 RepID=UPI00083256F1|nr:hypothetical protein [Herbidospora mongoliensis]